MIIPAFREEIAGDVTRGSNKDTFKKVGAAYIKAVARALQEIGSPLSLGKPTVKFNPGGCAVAGDTYGYFPVPGVEKQVMVNINANGIGTHRGDRICILYRIEGTGQRRHLGPNQWACGNTDSDDLAATLDRLARSA